MSDPIPGVTGEQVAKIFQTVEDRVSEHRSVQGQKRLLRIGGLVTACTAIATAASVALASFGFKVMGPPHEIAAQGTQIRALNAKVDTLKLDVDSIKADRLRYRIENDRRMARMEEDLRMTRYLACVLVKKTDPILAPKDC